MDEDDYMLFNLLLMMTGVLTLMLLYRTCIYNPERKFVPKYPKPANALPVISKLKDMKQQLFRRKSRGSSSELGLGLDSLEEGKPQVEPILKDATLDNRTLGSIVNYFKGQIWVHQIQRK